MHKSTLHQFSRNSDECYRLTSIPQPPHTSPRDALWGLYCGTSVWNNAGHFMLFRRCFVPVMTAVQLMVNRMLTNVNCTGWLEFLDKRSCNWPCSHHFRYSASGYYGPRYAGRWHFLWHLYELYSCLFSFVASVQYLMIFMLICAVSVHLVLRWCFNAVGWPRTLVTVE